MKPLKEGCHSHRSGARQPRESVTLAARVFSNYVLVPGRRGPDGLTRPCRLHGAGVLVFADEPSQQVQLRTGYATDVGRQPLVPRAIAAEDIGDEIASGHRKGPPFAAWKAIVVAATVILVLLLCAANTFAQSIEAPKPQLDKTEWALLAADAGARGLDVYSTHWAESAGNKEATLPGWIANHPPVMALYSGGIVAVQYLVACKLFAHGHRKLAYAITTADLSITTPYAIHNLFLPVCVAPNIYTTKGCQAP